MPAVNFPTLQADRMPAQTTCSGATATSAKTETLPGRKAALVISPSPSSSKTPAPVPGVYFV